MIRVCVFGMPASGLDASHRMPAFQAFGLGGRAAEILIRDLNSKLELPRLEDKTGNLKLKLKSKLQFLPFPFPPHPAPRNSIRTKTQPECIPKLDFGGYT